MNWSDQTRYQSINASNSESGTVEDKGFSFKHMSSVMFQNEQS